MDNNDGLMNPSNAGNVPHGFFLYVNTCTVEYPLTSWVVSVSLYC